MGIILLCILAFIGYLVLSGFKYDSHAKIGMLDGKGTAEIEQIKETREKGNKFAVAISEIITFKNGKSIGVFNIENAPDNNYIMVVEIYTTEDNKLIYKSDGIKVGEMIEKDSLDTDLKKGSYRCSVVFKALDEDTHEEIGKSTYETRIVVEE